MKNQEREAVMVTDFQKGFADKSLNELYVEGGETIAPIINELMKEVKSKGGLVVASKDMHREGNVSFAQNFIGKEPITTVAVGKQPGEKNFVTLQEIQNWTETQNGLAPSAGFTVVELKAYLETLPNQTMIMWPRHCVVNTPGSDFQEDFDATLVDIEVAKGYNHSDHPYSASPGIEVGGTRNLEQIFEDEGITKIKGVGLAEDWCVKDTVIDLAKPGKFMVELIRKATKSVNPANEIEYLEEMREAGVKIIE